MLVSIIEYHASLATFSSKSFIFLICI